MLLTSVDAAADSISVTQSTSTSTVTEGSSFVATISLHVVATQANTYSIADFSAPGLSPSSGDQTDKPTFGPVSNSCPFSFSAGTYDCTITFNFTTTLPAGDNSDTGIWTFTYPEFVLNNNVFGGTAYSGFPPPTDTITINDPGGSPVPEPGTVVLLGSGFLGLTRWVNRRRLT